MMPHPAIFSAALPLIFAANFRAIGLTIAVVVLAAFVALFLRNVAESRKELGAEVELAANRIDYLPDTELEGTKLDRSLTFALGILTITAIVLPFYWLAEPGRQEGAIVVQNETFVRRGAALYTGGAQCVNCHSGGGVGGTAPYVFQDADGQFLANANWSAPALNNILNRYTEEEITYVLNFGRPGSPMAAWGTPGGGPLTSQQIEYLVEYMRTLQVQSLDPLDIDEIEDPEENSEARAAADKLTEDITAEVERSLADGEFETVGEAVFNMGLNSGFKGGSLSCGRCHTSQWSLGAEIAPTILSDGVAGCGGGTSGIGFSLCGGLTDRFPDDSWKAPDGTWLPAGGIDDGDGFHILAQDGTEIALDDRGNPFTGEFDADENPIQYAVLENGDLADCGFYSAVWYPDDRVADAYPFDPEYTISLDEETGQFENPPELDTSALSGQVLEFPDGSLGGDCTVVEMPERTSQAQYEFIFNGAEAGVGYGEGGQSAAGLMPGFGKNLPPEYIQAVVDYTRSLG